MLSVSGRGAAGHGRRIRLPEPDDRRNSPAPVWRGVGKGAPHVPAHGAGPGGGLARFSL